MLRPLAFYLPQFHPIPENDLWWGPGFTEWTNVTRATPRFRGHMQPRLPRDLGFYDLRLAEARRSQATLARDAGIDGFVFYHYWFNGRRLLHEPIDGILSDPGYTFPFCFSWANENWTRAWDGGANEVLLGQSYSEEDDRAHIRWLLSVMKDERYIKREGRPVLLVHRVSMLPDPSRTTDIWREEAVQAGFTGLYLLRTEHFSDECGDPTFLGFDAAVDFQPNFAALPQASRHRALLNRLRPRQWHRQDRILEYDEVVRAMRNREPVAYTRWPGVFPGWDNSPRRIRGALIVRNAEPAGFRLLGPGGRSPGRGDGTGRPALRQRLERVVGRRDLEPDLSDGRAFLDALQHGLST